jgi:hypothetical protein
MAAVAVRVALMVGHVKQLRHMATAQAVSADCLAVVVAEEHRVVAHSAAALEARSVLFTPVTHANSRQLM